MISDPSSSSGSELPSALSPSSSKRSQALRRALARNMIALVVLSIGAVLAILVLAAYRSVDDLSRTLLRTTAEQMDGQLEIFILPVHKILDIGRGWGAVGHLHLGNRDMLNEMFMPALASVPQVSGLIVAHSSGREYFLLNEGDRMKVRERDPENWGKRFRVTYWRDPATPIGEPRWEELEYDPHTRPWYRGAVKLLEDGQAAVAAREPDRAIGEVQTSRFWTEPYTFFTTQEPGITVASAWRGKDGGVTVIGADVLLRAVSQFTASRAVGVEGFAFMLDDQDRVVGLPPGVEAVDDAAIKQKVLTPAPELGSETLALVVEDWNRRGRGEHDAFSLDTPDGRWWAGMRTHPLSTARVLHIGVAVPEADFLAPMREQRSQVILIGAATLAVALAMAWWMGRAFNRSLKDAIEEARQVGQYRLEYKLGEGAMGAVYCAHHSMLRRPTAIKVVRGAAEHKHNVMKRFEREAQLTSRLNHPNTIAVYDFGHTPDGTFYYAMELIEGFGLNDVVAATGPMPPERVIYLLRQMCGSLAEAHGIGLVHRDIKPGNIMLTKRASNPDFVKVLDFGLVKEFESEDPELTQANVVAGTPAYLAPEAITSPKDVGPGVDIYALGCVAYILLTNRPVFGGKTNIEVCTRHVREAPVPPSITLGASVPSDLEQIVMECLEKAPSQRPASAQVLGRRLTRCADANGWNPLKAREWWAGKGKVLTDRAAAQARQREALSLAERLTIDLGTRN